MGRGETHPWNLSLVCFDLFKQHAMIFCFESWLHLIESCLIDTLFELIICIKRCYELYIFVLIENTINAALDDVEAHLAVAVSELHAVL